MDNYRKTSHAVYRCDYHFVWIPKYRFSLLEGELKQDLKEILRELCEWKGFEIIEGAISKDHIHMLISVPPKYSPAYVMKILKGKSAERLGKRFPEIRKKYWGMHIWARGYFVSTTGIDDQTIREYVQKQQQEEIKHEQLRLWRD